MTWTELTSLEEIGQIDVLSREKPVLIYKHSTRCGISGTVLGRIERTWKDQEGEFVSPYYLDLLKYRTISDEIAKHYSVNHESPQVLLIKNGKCVYSQSHMSISVPEIFSHLLG